MRPIAPSAFQFSADPDIVHSMAASRRHRMSNSSAFQVHAATQEADLESAPLRKSPSRMGLSSPPDPSAYAALFGVAILWGSYAPAIRYIFLTEE